MEIAWFNLNLLQILEQSRLQNLGGFLVRWGLFGSFFYSRVYSDHIQKNHPPFWLYLNPYWNPFAYGFGLANWRKKKKIPASQTRCTTLHFHLSIFVKLSRRILFENAKENHFPVQKHQLKMLINIKQANKLYH